MAFVSLTQNMTIASGTAAFGKTRNCKSVQSETLRRFNSSSAEAAKESSSDSVRPKRKSIFCPARKCFDRAFSVSAVQNAPMSFTHFNGIFSRSIKNTDINRSDCTFNAAYFSRLACLEIRKRHPLEVTLITYHNLAPLILTRTNSASSVAFRDLPVTYKTGSERYERE